MTPGIFGLVLFLGLSGFFIIAMTEPGKDLMLWIQASAARTVISLCGVMVVVSFLYALVNWS